MATSPHPLVRPFCAELIGTLILSASVATAVVGVSVYSQYVYLFVPFVAGLAVAALVAVFGPVSGGHFNPAVSLGLWVAGRLPHKRLVSDVVAQLIGAVAGVGIAHQLIGAVPPVPLGIASTGFLAETCGAFLLVATVAAAVAGKIEKSVAPLYIGIALTVGVTASLGASGGLLNPAIALAFGARGVIYLVGPLVGGAVAAPLMFWLLGATGRLPGSADSYAEGEV